jgi:methyl-accepting chemotaxis protein
MTTAAHIDKAIGAHGMWKSRLKMAIDSGKIDAPIPTISADNKCAFGEWLYGPEVTAAQKASPHYQKVRTLHAAFHKQAAKVAEYATKGQKAEALKSIGLAGDYAKASADLTTAMREWKAAL